jgi:hypothetical protein
MNGPDLIESPAHRSLSSMTTFPPENKERVNWKSDEESVGTNNGSTTSMQRKIVRWKDMETASGASEGIYQDELSREDSNNMLPDSTDGDQIEERNLEDEQDVLYEDRDTREDYWESGRIDARDDDVRSTGSQVIGTSSTEDGSLRGSSLLPPRRYSSSFVRSHDTRIFGQHQQQQGGRFEDSRDDTVQSRDSSQLLYTYSSTSNHSQEFSESSVIGHISSDSNSNSNKQRSDDISGPSFDEETQQEQQDDDDESPFDERRNEADDDDDDEVTVTSSGSKRRTTSMLTMSQQQRRGREEERRDDDSLSLSKTSGISSIS